MLARRRSSLVALADPASKIAALVAFTVGLQMAHSLRGLVLCALAFLLLLAWQRPDWRVCALLLVPYSLLVLFVSALQYYSAHLPILAVVVYAVKLAALAVLSLLLLVTTPVGDLLRGLDRLLSPLRALGLPTRYLSLGVALAVRFFTLFLSGYVDIAKAQETRGLRLGIRGTTIPLVFKAERVVGDASEALVLRRVNFRNPTVLSLRRTSPWATALLLAGSALLVSIGVFL